MTERAPDEEDHHHCRHKPHVSSGFRLVLSTAEWAANGNLRMIVSGFTNDKGFTKSGLCNSKETIFFV